MKDWEKEIARIVGEAITLHTGKSLRPSELTRMAPDIIAKIGNQKQIGIEEGYKEGYRDGLLRGAEVASEICHCGNGTATHIRPSKTCTGRLVAESIRREAQ